MNFRIIISTIAMILFSTIIIAQETKEIKVDPFDEIKVEGSAQWELIPSDENKVVIESSTADVFDYINIENKGDNLVVSTTEKSKNITKLFSSVTIKIYFESIERISLGGVGSLKMTDSFSATNVVATLRGTGSMDLNITCSDFVGNIYGTGSLTIVGKAKSSTARVEGVGSFDGLDFETTDSDITVSGVGGAKVNATNTLTATINGVGSIRYKGDPMNKNFNSNGLGSIKKAKD